MKLDDSSYARWLTKVSKPIRVTTDVFSGGDGTPRLAAVMIWPLGKASPCSIAPVCAVSFRARLGSWVVGQKAPARSVLTQSPIKQFIPHNDSSVETNCLNVCRSRPHSHPRVFPHGERAYAVRFRPRMYRPNARHHDFSLTLASQHSLIRHLRHNYLSSYIIRGSRRPYCNRSLLSVCRTFNDPPYRHYRPSSTYAPIGEPSVRDIRLMYHL